MITFILCIIINQNIANTLLYCVIFPGHSGYIFRFIRFTLRSVISDWKQEQGVMFTLGTGCRCWERQRGRGSTSTTSSPTTHQVWLRTPRAISPSHFLRLIVPNLTIVQSVPILTLSQHYSQSQDHTMRLLTFIPLLVLLSVPANAQFFNAIRNLFSPVTNLFNGGRFVDDGTQSPQATGREELFPSDCGRNPNDGTGKLCFPDGILCQNSEYFQSIPPTLYPSDLVTGSVALEKSEYSVVI